MQSDELAKEGADAQIAVHAITAEPGGAEALRERFTRFGFPPLTSISMHSDPGWSRMSFGFDYMCFGPVYIF